MNDTKKRLEETINQAAKSAKPFSEDEVSTAIKHFVRNIETRPLPMEIIAEAMAFDFVENYPNTETRWGTYFGPFMVMPNEEGDMVESPSLSLVTPQMIKYWGQRSIEAKNPVLKARYADLVWDFSRPVIGTPADYTIACRVIDNILEIVDQNMHKRRLQVIDKLERALSLSLSLNDNSRIQSVINAIIAYEDKIAEDGKPGTWGFSFNLLLKNKKISLAPQHGEKIIHDLENRLDRLSSSSENSEFNPQNDPWAVQSAAILLAGHYRTLEQIENVRRVLTTFGNVLETACKSISIFQASAWLNQLYRIYREYGLMEEAEKTAVKVRDLDSRVHDEMHVITHTAEIPSEQIEAFINAMLKGDIEEVLIRIAAYFVPSKSETEDQLQQLSQKAPLQFLIPSHIRDYEGRILATIGPLDQDLQGHVVALMSRNMYFVSYFQRIVMNALVERFALSYDELLNYLLKSPLFKEGKKVMLQSGLQAYFEGNSLVALHLLIPQIEAAVRVLVEETGGSVLKPARNGGFHLKTLDELLRDPRVVDVLRDDTALYFRTLFTDQRGWNLRNDVCHGISPIESFDASAADRVVHALLILALVREEKNE